MLRILSKAAVCLVCIAGLVSCDKKTVFTQFKSTGGIWAKTDTVSISLKEPDTINAYNMFINLRNNEDYAYSNLYLIVELNYPDGKVDSDTLQYLMTKPNGEWLGSGFSSVKENKLWYKKAFRFPQSGNYKVEVLQAMRKNGSINGITDLEGVTDVGLSVEEITKK